MPESPLRAVSPWSPDVDWSVPDSEGESVAGSSVDLLEQLLPVEEFAVRRRGPTEELVFVEESHSYETAPPLRPNTAASRPWHKRSVWLFLLVSCYVYWGRPHVENTSTIHEEGVRGGSTVWSSNMQLARRVPKSLRYRSSTMDESSFGLLSVVGAVMAVLLVGASLVVVLYRRSRRR